MYPRSATAGLLVGRSHTIVAVLDVLHSGLWTARLSFTDGTVNAEGGRSITRNFTGTVVDPSGNMDGSDIRDLLSPADAEVAPYRGVLLPDGRAELAPLGVFQLTNRAVAAPGELNLSGQDRAIIYQGPMVNALAISAGTPVEAGIAKLLSQRNRALKMHSWVTGFTCGPLLFPPDINCWDEALKLAQSVGGLLQHDRHGDLAFEPGLPVSDNPVASYVYGDGKLLDADRAEDTDTVRNVVAIKSTRAGTAGVILAVVEDTDPTSPTYANGWYGRRPVTIESKHVDTAIRAQQMGANELARELGRAETSTITTLVDPWRDPNDVLLVHYPQKGLVWRSMVAASVATPLKAKGTMTIQCRRSVVGADGRVLGDSSAELP